MSGTVTPWSVGVRHMASVRGKNMPVGVCRAPCRMYLGLAHMPNSAAIIIPKFLCSRSFGAFLYLTRDVVIG